MEHNTILSADSLPEHLRSNNLILDNQNALELLDQCSIWPGLEQLEPRILLSSVQSDDFDTLTLDTAVWTIVDPLKDSTIDFDGDHLLFSVPKGVDHDIWTAGNRAPRIMQNVDDTDFEVEIKFENAPDGKHAFHGFIVQEDLTNFLRFDFVSHNTGNDLYVFSADFTNGTPNVQIHQKITDDQPIIMRVQRTGDLWTQQFTYDGTNWINGASFTYDLNVTQVGLFVGNAAGTTSPAYTSQIDYIHDIDDTGSQDTIPPEILNLIAATTSSTIDVSFNTNELATAVIHYGETDQFELGTINLTNLQIAHNALIDNLNPLTNYLIKIEATDQAGNTRTSPTLAVRTEAPTQADPVIDIWYGSEQSFGQIGNPQNWINILGNAYDDGGIASLSYTLNGGPSSNLSLGPDTRRLLSEGDFNVELDINDLNDGQNTVAIIATDFDGNSTIEYVTVNYTQGQVWPVSYSPDWSTANNINDVAQVVDGLWEITNSSIRTIEIGYDRIVAIGDKLWQDFVITVPITIHSFDMENGFNDPSYGPGIGVLTRWQGHYDWDGSQPQYGYEPLGGIGWYRWRANGSYARLAIEHNDGPVTTDLGAKQLEFETTYMFKMKVETIAGADHYSLKVWQQGTTEPAQWDLTSVGPADGLDYGSVLLLAHHTDATFGVPVIEPVFDENPPIITDINTVALGTSISVTGTTNELSTWTVEWGLDTNYGLGSISETAANITHQLQIDDLDPLTPYYLRVTATDINNNQTVTDGIMVVTEDLDETAPVISNLAISSQPNEITVNLDTDELATITVQYGLTDSYELGSVSTTTQALNHSLNINNLDPTTTYLLNITASDVHGNTTTPIETTYDTAAPPTITSDNFDQPSLDTSVWQFIDPVGNSNISFNGSQLTFDIPGGSDHDVWSQGNFAARIMQDAPNEDFQIEVKFDSIPTGEFAMNGLLVEQDADNFLRFDFFSTEEDVRGYAAAFQNNQPEVKANTPINLSNPNYMRITRQGNVWTQRYSNDGENWNTITTFSHTLNVSKVGVFAGNAPGVISPPHTAVVDYFLNTDQPTVDQQPPVVSNLAVIRGVDTLTLTANSDEPATWQIQYGLTQNYEQTPINITTPTTSLNTILSNLDSSSTYYIRIIATDLPGNATDPIDLTTSTLAPGQIISDDFADATLDPAIWTVIDPLNDVDISITDGQLFMSIPQGVAHDIVTGVKNAPRIMQAVDNTDFDIQVKFDDLPTGQYAINGLLIEQDDANFLRFDFYSSDTGTNVIAINFSNAGPSVNEFNAPIAAELPAIMRVIRSGDQWTQQYSFDGDNWITAAQFTRSMTVTNIGIHVANAGNNPPAHTAVVDFMLNTAQPFTDVTPPVISNLQTATDKNSILITADTHEKATFTVDYGLTDSYELGSITSSTFTFDQSALLQSLDSGTDYYLRITATDQAANTTDPVELVVQTATFGLMSSDEFNDTVIDGLLWTSIDPVGNSQITANGSQLLITVPSGSTHDIWDGVKDAARVMQPTSDTDFQIEAKFDNIPAGEFAMNGILVEQDDDHFMRLEFYSSATDIHVFAATFTATGDPVVKFDNIITAAQAQILRITRIGEHWTIETSNDAANFNLAGEFDHAISVANVGLYAGNARNNPEHTAAVDYFHVLQQPVVNPVGPDVLNDQFQIGPEKLLISAQTLDQATVTLDFGLTANYELGTLTLTGDGLSHSTLLDQLTADTDYYVRLTATDLNSNVGTPVERIVHTQPAGQIVSDEFNSTQLNTAMWRLRNPQGDGTATTDGSNLIIDVPEGVDHDIWNQNNGVLLLQDAANQNLDLEIKINNQPSGEHAFAGIMVWQDNSNFIRFDFVSHGDTNDLWIFHARFINNVPRYRTHIPITDTGPLYMRITRVGNLWTQFYSYNGFDWITAATFNHTMNVTEVGLLAGNAFSTSSPAYAPQFEYFRNNITPTVDETPPVVTNVLATPTADTINITANADEPATWQILYGLTPAYEMTPVNIDSPTGILNTTLVNLDPDTPYYIRIIATDVADNEAAPIDLTVNTIAPPQANSDEFNSAQLDEDLWTIVDPVNNSTISTNGSQLVIDVPAGSDHDVWNKGNKSARVMQDIADSDFVLEVKFDSIVSGQYTLQGLLIEQDANNFLRFDVFSTSSTDVNIFAASFVGKTPTTQYSQPITQQAPMIMRITRTGDQWLQEYSFNGTDWVTAASFTYALNVSKVGVFAGNASGSNSPAFTSQVDYFRILD